MLDIPLGTQTDFLINRYDTEQELKPNYTVYRSPDKPDYYFGNLLCVADINRFSVEEWQNEFNSAFTGHKQVRHFTFVWNQAQAQIEAEQKQAFEDLGYVYEEFHVRTMRPDQFNDSPANPDFEYRVLKSDSDWQQFLDISVEYREKGHDAEGYRAYEEKKIVLYKRLEKDGAGHYWGAFKGDQLVAFAGFYHQSGLGRFQHVRTLPDFQRKGLCKSLLCTIIKQAIEQGIETLVIVADEHYHATALYGSLGFAITSREASLCWWPKN